jgi:L-threonylcarbamoyladenylate synthase
MNRPRLERPHLETGTRRTDGGSLPTSMLRDISTRLIKGGLALLPSDTCYSLGALPNSRISRSAINSILGRQDHPISLAFGDLRQVEEYVHLNNTVAILLERFTPGPITIVCKALDSVSDEFLFQNIGSHDRTIGVRITDSSVERDIAASTVYPIMTVAVRERNGDTVRDYERAVEVVSGGIRRANWQGYWAGIESTTRFHFCHSTVVRVVADGTLELLREGDFAFDEIQHAVTQMSTWAIQDWT